jgi:hypothetical protein
VPPHAPADDDHPNVAMLKADIDSGRTGDKVEVFDPGMAMIGTCEEAAGTPLQPEQIKMIREYETKRRWRLGSKKTGAAHEHGPNYALTASAASSRWSPPCSWACSGWRDPANFS